MIRIVQYRLVALETELEVEGQAAEVMRAIAEVQERMEINIFLMIPRLVLQAVAAAVEVLASLTHQVRRMWAVLQAEEKAQCAAMEHTPPPQKLAHRWAEAAGEAFRKF